MKQQENIKDSTFAKATVDKQILKLKNVILPALRSLGVGGIFVFLFFNLIYSQLISPVYFGFVNNDKNAAVSLLGKIKAFPEFQNILEMNKNIYGKTVEEETFHQENDEKLMINNLEQKLRINPKARDVLYSLYLLYKERGNNLIAEKYLKQAKEIDPGIK